ncbi:kiaa0651 protein [Lynx pardinus]|uniref:Kiaa0651 protein n=1 Tax=Lynx pardinus TaxID=191816 RepID=A0A485NUS9_LYNPA|nr:kiaa0651 protein [Lynx pardinus]
MAFSTLATESFVIWASVCAHTRTHTTGLRVPPMSGDFPKEFLAGGDLVSRGHSRRCLSVDESRAQLEEEEEEEEEEQEGKKKEGDGFHTVPLRRSGAFRAHSHHPFKRHSWGPDRDLQDPLSRSKLQTSGCTCPQEPPLVRSREELDAFLELQHQGGRPSRVGQSCCHPSVGPLDRSATGMLSKSASMSGISCLLGCSDPAGNLCQPSATDLSRSCSQLEGGSGTWADSPLRRTLSFLLGMTGKAKGWVQQLPELQLDPGQRGNQESTTLWRRTHSHACRATSSSDPGKLGTAPGRSTSGGGAGERKWLIPSYLTRVIERKRWALSEGQAGTQSSLKMGVEAEKGWSLRSASFTET